MLFKAGALADVIMRPTTALWPSCYVSYKTQTAQSYAFALSYLRTVPNGWNWLEPREHWVRVCRFAQMR
jgi:hypothetical protein